MQRSSTQPIVVAFDGSEEARAAVAAAADLFAGRPLLIVSVWERGLAMVVQPTPDPWVPGYAMTDPEEVATIDRIQRDHAGETAEAGAQLARDLGATAEPMPVSDAGDIAARIREVAEARDAAALVVGSRGLGAVKSKVLGSTSRRLLHDSRRPVVVVRKPERP